MKMENKSGVARIYPSAPLETTVNKEQKETLLPPTYDQATGDTPPPAVEATSATGPHVVVVTQPAATPYGPHPVDVLCPFCHNYTRTRLRYKPTSRTHLIAFLLCLFQLYCCICLPYCIGSCMNTNHYCGMCDKYLGTYLRS